MFWERSGESLTPHLQGYFEIPNGFRKSRPAMIKCLQDDGCPSKPHLEVAQGTAHQAITYCEKDGTFGKKENVQRDKVSVQILMKLPV